LRREPLADRIYKNRTAWLADVRAGRCLEAVYSLESSLAPKTVEREP
jgi:hypothetical protein